jgi:TPR repeat protein
VPQDYGEAAKWYRKAADQNYALAQSSLGPMYQLGRGVPHDEILALMWYHLAAAQGDDYAKEARDELTPDQIAEAQRLAREWKPTR